MLVFSFSLISASMVQVHGTEYKAGDNGKVFLQLLDDSYKPINDSACYSSIYYPTNEVWKYQQLMTYVDEGIYAYDFTTPYVQGVYPVVILCTTDGISYVSQKDVSDNFESGTTSGGIGWDTNWQLSSCSIDGTNTHTGSYSLYCRDDRDPNRRIDSNTTYVRLDYDFWFMATGFGSNEYVYIEMQDASNIEHTMQIISNANADGSWQHAVGSLSLDGNNFDFDGQIRFELDTSGNVDWNDKYYIDDINITLGSAIAINDTEYETVRGSGEVHVESGDEYYIEMDYGTLTNESFEGYMYIYYNIISGTSVNKSEMEIKLDLFKAFPCKSIDSVYLKDQSGTWNNVSWNSFLDTTREDRCGIRYEQNLSVGESYEVYVKLRNNWRVATLGMFQSADVNQQVITDGCNYYQQQNNLSSYTVPLTESPNVTDDFWLNCQYYFDKFYTFNTTINNEFILHPQGSTNFTKEDMDRMEGVYQEIIRCDADLNSLMDSIMNVWQQSDSYSNTIINGGSSIPYLTFFAYISSSYLGLDAIAEDVWNYVGRYIHGTII